MPENEETATTSQAGEKSRRGRPRKAEGTKRRTRRTAKKTTARAQKPRTQKSNLLFALDIGTRSVIGITATKEKDGTIAILATERQEHATRAMLDGQIHDVPQVAAVIRGVKEKLEGDVGPLKSAAVAAAGRALYTMTATAEKQIAGVIRAEDERDLDFAGVQAAQAKLAASHTVDDPTHYYCVGYSTIRYELDGSQLKSLVGQRGDVARAEVIATFLPRQVIDSMQSALEATGLSMQALTLEPIAAINVLIPPTMRHLNLVLVDIGAGTSDIAITKNGSVIAYGMVPKAGDEITEAISQNFLLDFNVAEHIKRQAANGEGVHFSDILGASYDLSAQDVIKPILPQVRDLAGSIASEITRLNGTAPQAVMLVGGGALTPMLRDYVAEALELPENRVAVRQPQDVSGLADIPEILHSPDAVTPLGILKIASLNTLHFLRVRVNGTEHSLFNFRTLTVADALLNAGINLRKWNGRPGLALMVTVDGKTRSFPGTLGTLARLAVDGEAATLDTEIKDGSDITVVRGEDGASPEVRLADVTEHVPALHVSINGAPQSITAKVLINDREAGPSALLADGDSVTSRMPESFGEVLRACGLPPQGRRVHYRLNGEETSYVSSPVLRANDLPASLSLPVHEGDRLTYGESSAPTLGSVLGITELDAALVVYYEGIEHKIPSAALTLKVGGVPVSPDTPLAEGADVTYEKSERKATTVSDALVAVGFEPPAATSRVSAQILVNDAPVDFTAPIKNGDTLAVKLTPLASTGAADSSTQVTPQHGAETMATAGAMHTASAAGAARTENAAKAADAAANTANTTNAANAVSPRYTSLTEALGLTAPPAETGTAAPQKNPTISIADLTRND